MKRFQQYEIERGKEFIVMIYKLKGEISKRIIKGQKKVNKSLKDK